MFLNRVFWDVNVTKESKTMGRRQTSLITSIGLYAGGLLLVLFAVLLLLQATGVIPAVSNTVYVALVLLAVGCGLLYGIGNRA